MQPIWQIAKAGSAFAGIGPQGLRQRQPIFLPASKSNVNSSWAEHELVPGGPPIATSCCRTLACRKARRRGVYSRHSRTERDSRREIALSRQGGEPPITS